MNLSSRTSALADRYRIERELGAGGMATVYLAQDLKRERQVAIKVLRDDLSASLGKDRFLRSRIAALTGDRANAALLLGTALSKGRTYNDVSHHWWAGLGKAKQCPRDDKPQYKFGLS